MKIRCFRDPKTAVTITRFKRLNGTYLFIVKDETGKKYLARESKNIRPEHRKVLIGA